MAHGRRQVRSLFRSIGLPLFMQRSSSFTRLEQLKKALDRIDQLEREKSATSGKIDQMESATSARLGQVEQSVRGVQGSPSLFNPAIGMVIDATAEHRGKAGGNFNFRAAEMG